MNARIDIPALHRLMADSSGPFARYLNSTVGPAVVSAVKAEVPVGERDARGSPHLRDAIHARPQQVRGFAGLSITADAPHAASVHEGSKPHRIYPRRARALAFHWDEQGVDVVVPRGGGFRTMFRGGVLYIGKGRVDHPGHPAGNHFLTRGAFRAGLRNVRHI